MFESQFRVGAIEEVVAEESRSRDPLRRAVFAAFERFAREGLAWVSSGDLLAAVRTDGELERVRESALQLCLAALAKEGALERMRATRPCPSLYRLARR